MQRLPGQRGYSLLSPFCPQLANCLNESEMRSPTHPNAAPTGRTGTKDRTRVQRLLETPHAHFGLELNALLLEHRILNIADYLEDV